MVVICGLKTTINLIVGRSIRVVLERRCVGVGSMWGTPSHRLGQQMERQKNREMGGALAIDGCQTTTSHTTTNQKQAVGMEGNMEGRCDKRKARGKCNSIVLGALEVE